ncbi:MAG: methyl-accepting chemotaxis protein [Pseudomonadota bacterium]
MTARPDDPQLDALAERVNGLMALFDGFARSVGGAFEALSQGRLKDRAAIAGPGIYAEVEASADASFEKLQELVSALRDATQRISGDVEAMMEDSRALSDRTEAQAAALQETAAAMEEITSAVRATAEAAGATDDLSSDAARTAAGGVGVASEAQDAMQALKDGAERIQEITGMVDQIAFQTNLLALNASVEAARAGEAGKGFAVVAGEVRELAKRAADAAAQIKQLTDANGAGIDTSVDRVEAASGALGRIREALDAVKTSMEGIRASSDEQTRAVSEIAETITTLDQQTQRNAEAASGAASAAAGLATQADRLRELIAFFEPDGARSVRRAA